MDQALIQSVYDHIARRPNDYSVANLIDACGMSQPDVQVALDTLKNRGLVKQEGKSVVAVKWCEQPHVELLLNIPFVEEEVFWEYCQDIDALSIQLRDDGINALRPYAHETALEIIVGAAAGFAIAEFFKAFLSELGKKLANFVQESVKKHHKKGINKVEIIGVRNSTEYSVSFSVKGSEVESVASSFDSLSDSLEKAENSGAIKKLAPGDEFSVSGGEWKATIRRNQ